MFHLEKLEIPHELIQDCAARYRRNDNCFWRLNPEQPRALVGLGDVGDIILFVVRCSEIRDVVDWNWKFCHQYLKLVNNIFRHQHWCSARVSLMMYSFKICPISSFLSVTVMLVIMLMFMLLTLWWWQFKDVGGKTIIFVTFSSCNISHVDDFFK